MASRDGSKIAKLSNMLPAFQLLRSGVKYNVSKLNYIGRAASMQYVTMVWHTTGVKSLEDAQKAKNPIVFGSSGKSQSNYIVPAVMKNLLGLNVKVIAGYPGTADINKALEQGEVTGRAGAWSSWIAAGARLVNTGKVVAIAQAGTEKATDIKNGYGEPVPLLLDLAKNDEERAILYATGLRRRDGPQLLGSPGSAEGARHGAVPGVRRHDEGPRIPGRSQEAEAHYRAKTCEWLNAFAQKSWPRQSRWLPRRSRYSAGNDCKAIVRN